MAKNIDLLSELLEIDVFKLGQFTLKSGVLSPIYIDLRTIITFPGIVKKIVNEIQKKQDVSNIQMDVICGVPYTALPIASVYSVLNSVPMIMKRKEVKDHGTKKMVEGIFKRGDKCLIIEDIVSSGSSIIETAEVLRNEGLVVTDCISVLNRMQGGIENLAKNGITLHSLFDIHELFNKYCHVKGVESSVVESVKNYLNTNSYIPIANKSKNIIPLEERASNCQQAVLKKLFDVMISKKTNLCVSVDELLTRDLLEVAEKVGPHICILKTHIDILTDFNAESINQLQQLAKKHNFLIMEDRKFADIGNTVMHQYFNGVYNIRQWADIVTVHGIPGCGIIEALKTADDRACVLIAEMSSKGSLTDNAYQNKIVDMAKKYPEFVIGFVSQHKLTTNGNDCIIMTPGVNISSTGDSFGQQYNTPEAAVENGADIIIVGRGICKAPNVEDAALQYKNAGFYAYLKNVNLS